MKDAIGLQSDLPDIPEEEKSSRISIIACTSSNYSGFLCYQK